MGINHVWTILTPFCERKPLFELEGKTVAVDLSCWICEAQNIAEYEVQPRMYLRTLYFRTCYLLLMNVTPVFVLEGKAPELKYDTIAARNAIQFKGAKPKTKNVKTGKDRTRFHHILRRCEEMLSYMGITCIKGEGEAESMCAYLNDEGLVDGCISQDSDCFAYGAKVVYRNFSISSQGAHSATGGAVDIYDIRKAYESINFGRNKIVTMALLCGCDYTEGVQGIGKESVLKFFEKISDEEVLNRLKSWKNTPNLYEEYESRISDKDICKSCGHQGKLQAHTKNGCVSCRTTKGCDPFKFKEERLRIKNELNMRNKALQDPNFPDEKLINEFLTRKDNISELNLKWKQPDIVGFVKFTHKFLQWDEIYSFEKILPILTRWQCLNCDLLKKHKEILYAKQIKKIRNPKGIPSFEIIWSDPHSYFENLLPDNQITENKINLEKLWSTIEPQSLVEKAYPELVRAFRNSKVKRPKVNTRKKKQIEKENIGDTSASVPAVKKTKKTNLVSWNENDVLDNLEKSFKHLDVKKKTGKLDSFLKKAVLHSQAHDLVEKQISDVTKLQFNENVLQTSTPSKRIQNLSANMNWSSFYDEDDNANLSDIIDTIVLRKPVFVTSNFQEINTNLLDNFNTNKGNLVSSFFMNYPNEIDVFEKTFNEITEGSEESTEEYEQDEINDILESKSEDQEYTSNVKQKSCEQAALYDSFLDFDINVPLIERIRKEM